MRSYEHGGDVYANPGIRLDFSININPLGMPDAARRAVAKGVRDYERYPDPHCRGLTRALAAHHNVKEEMLLCGNGAAELLFRLSACLRGKNALVPAPTFSEYARAVGLFGGRMRAHRLREEHGFSLSGKIIGDIRDREIFFLCNPNNPTGRLADPALVCRIADECARRGTILLIDECFMDFTEGESMTARIETYPNMIVLRAFTKIYAMAGLRLGYMLCADHALLSRIAEYGATWNVSGVAQAAGLAALGEEKWIGKTRSLIQAERAYMTRALTDLGVQVFLSDANFLLMKSAAKLHGPLKQKGMLVRSCGNFTGLGEDFLRIGIKKHAENEALVCAIKEEING